MADETGDERRLDGDSAIVIVVAEAEPAVAEWRTRHDPAAAVGVPPHITLLYPWLPAATIERSTIDALGRHFARVAPFDYRLARVDRFEPDILFLAPEPGWRFSELIRRLAALYPDTPPYGGLVPDIVPHVTVADGCSPATLELITAALELELPIRARADAATLLIRQHDRWRAAAALPFGGSV